MLHFGKLLVLAVALPSVLATGATSRSDRYPNELLKFKFYSRRLYPLRPLESTRSQVAMILGSDQTSEVGGWRITPSFLTQAQAPLQTDRLHTIVITPKERVPMSGVKFPRTFRHDLGGISEGGGDFDIYDDRFGLAYWVCADVCGYGAETEGDLVRIEYGPAR